MFFQVFENQFFHNNQVLDFLPEDCTKTWDHQTILKDHSADYAFVWGNGQSLDDLCPDQFYEDWKKISKKIKGFIRSYQAVGADISNYQLKQIIPEKFVLKYLFYKNLISQHVFENFEKPVNYDFMNDLHKMCSEIAQNNLKLNLDKIKYTLKHQDTYKKLQRTSENIQYDAYKTITGRLSIKPMSFPILNLKKECRGVIEPYKHCFVELDFNAAELRTFLALLDIPQPEEDIHNWIGEEVYGGKFERDKVKQKVFSWLYDPRKKDEKLEKIFQRKKILEKYYNYNTKHITTVFERSIPCEEHYALNYIIQSTTSDLFLRQAIKVWKMLKGKETNVAFTIHDSLVLDFHLSDQAMVNRMIEEFSNTDLGKFKVNFSGGKDFGEMKAMNI
tara:strand:- start:798 stop:1964 length:1167 start_codon:yes stop_codon:yes gene_type:complete